MDCRKIITGIKDYEIHELKQILDTYIYNKNDNNYNGEPVYKIKDNDLPKEIFEKYPKNINISYWGFREYLRKTTDIIEVSNLGRIKINNKIQEQKEIKYGYLFIDTIDKKPYYVYRLVAETWCPCPVEETNKFWQVHHITNNGHDNRPNNLIWVNANEHRVIDPYPYKRTIELKNDLFNKFDEIIYKNNTESITQMFHDIVLIGNKFDKKRIEQYITKIDIDLEDMKNILWINIGIKI
jgi:hypothetical protein